MFMNVNILKQTQEINSYSTKKAIWLLFLISLGRVYFGVYNKYNL